VGRKSPIMAVKSAGSPADGPFLSKEIEVCSPSFRPDLTLFDKTTADGLIEMVGNGSLKAQFETQVTRRTAVITSGRSQIEIAFDKGSIVSGKKSAPLTEVELELKQGSETDLYDLAMMLAEELPLWLDFVSKGERGFHIVTGKAPAPVKAEPIHFNRQATLDDAVWSVVSNTLAHFVANWGAFRETEHPEAVHQMRVALRRMRTGLAMFKPEISCPELDVLLGDAKRIASELGPARGCDAFREYVEKGPLAHLNPPASGETLMASVEDRRVAGYKQAREVIESRVTTLFVLRVQSFLARRAWLSAPPSTNLRVKAKVFARDALDKLTARVRKRGKGLAGDSDEARHKLRIALKNLRYGAEFFGGLFNRRRRIRSYVKKFPYSRIYSAPIRRLQRKAVPERIAGGT